MSELRTACLGGSGRKRIWEKECSKKKCGGVSIRSKRLEPEVAGEVRGRRREMVAAECRPSPTSVKVNRIQGFTV